jgi:hypothetical protein
MSTLFNSAVVLLYLAIDSIIFRGLVSCIIFLVLGLDDKSFITASTLQHIFSLSMSEIEASSTSSIDASHRLILKSRELMLVIEFFYNLFHCMI